MSLKQVLYSVFVAALILAVSLFALMNLQDVTVVIPFLGEYQTKLFMLIVVSYIAGFLTAAFLSLLTRLFSIPSRRKKERENRPVSETVKSGETKESGEDSL
ncbi:lipopolysaccharide assembly protein LapA domain-containing protein [Desulfurobacterium atlanticum]|uniref:Lipopolysaccharide assembly protein A domain-containing protein n=1 Tax=Desulfurobacterium atlanticum TaxID=240169 RepID=A0A238XKN6_9BACT|nr:lipopolysaccharide assembly protein LapA domain-containing protein [Desulfurobacterium atlanticum]SNR58539.1 Protein of unknown function [Desulfurobacterium atlanticum]